jgi:hypothetical protein
VDVGGDQDLDDVTRVGGRRGRVTTIRVGHSFRDLLLACLLLVFEDS